MIQNKHKFAFLLCMLLMTTTVFGASEAEYKKLAKTWTLNADAWEVCYSISRNVLCNQVARKTG